MAATRGEKRLTWATLVRDFGVYAVLIAGFVFTLVPFIYVFLASFKTEAELLRIPPTFFPEHPTLKHYITILTDPTLPLERVLWNSAVVALARTAAVLFTSTVAGYIFAKFEFRGKSLAFWLIFAQIMIPFQVILIPLYLITDRLGLLDTLWALIIPMMVDAYGVFMMKQFIEGIPGEIMEAARIDGASEWRIFLQIVLPLLGPPMASLGIFTFMFAWNDYLWPLIAITSPEKRTVPLLLVWYTTQHASNQGLVLAASMLVLLPIFAVYILAQRWIIEQATQSYK